MTEQKCQSTILPMHCLHGIFLEGSINIDKGKYHKEALTMFKGNIMKFTQQLDVMQKKYPESRLAGSISFSSDVWNVLTDKVPKPIGLKSINTLSDYMPNTTQHDMLIHILSDRFDTCFKLAQDTIDNFGSQFKEVKEIHGFRRVEERDLTGFIDGTENPNGDKLRALYGLVPAGKQNEFGSYVFTQRFVHNLVKWNQETVPRQQEIIGRTKEESEEIPADKRPVGSHVSRTDLNENGKDLKIIRQSLPYGDITGIKGLFFISYSTSLNNIEKQLESMFGKSSDHKKDLLLNYTTPVTSSFYFCPSKKELLDL